MKFVAVASLLPLLGAGCLSLSGSSTGTTGPAGMYVSTDKGESWVPISAMPSLEGAKQLSNVSVFRLVQDPQDTKTMYWGSREHGLFYTYDDGKQWQQVTGPLSSGFVYGVSIHPGDKCTIYATNGQFIYKTTDCSRSWTELYRESRGDTNVVSVAINPFPPHQVYVAETNGDVLMSIDLGQSWSIVRRFGVRLVNLIPDPLQEGVMYLTTRESGLFRSVDAGRTWADLSGALEPFTKAKEYRSLQLHPNKPNVLYWISTYGILVSNDGGSSWGSIDLLTPPGSVNIYGFAINPKNDKEMYYTGTISNRSTLYRSIDGGQNWITKKLPSGQIPTALRVHPDNESWLFLGFTTPPKQ